jgi:hypothetical protein
VALPIFSVAIPTQNAGYLESSADNAW